MHGAVSRFWPGLSDRANWPGQTFRTTMPGREPSVGARTGLRVSPIPMAYRTLHLHFGMAKSMSNG